MVGRRVLSSLDGSRSPAGMGLAAALCVLGAGCVVAAAQAAPTTTFVSKQYAYSISFPGGAGGWSASYAFAPWSTDSIEPGSPAFDTYLDTHTGRRFAIAARRPPTGATLGKWTAYTVGTVSSTCTKPKDFSNSTLGGAPARVFTWTCPAEFSVFAIAAVHGSLGYFMFVSSPLGLSQASNESAFEAARSFFRFAK